MDIIAHTYNNNVYAVERICLGIYHSSSIHNRYLSYLLFYDDVRVYSESGKYSSQIYIKAIHISASLSGRYSSATGHIRR